MKVKDTRLVCIFFRILPDFETTGIPSVYCENDPEEVEKAIEKNKQYRIIFACAVEHLEQMRQFIKLRCINQVFLIGQYATNIIEGREVNIVNTNERNLRKNIMYSVMKFINEEEVKLRQLGENRLADERAHESLELLQQIEDIHLQDA